MAVAPRWTPPGLGGAPGKGEDAHVSLPSHAERYKQIGEVLTRHGLGFLDRKSVV